MTTARPTPGEPAEMDGLVALALREHRAGRLAEAAEAYRKILAIRRDAVEAHNNLGMILAQQGKLDEAAAQYQRAMALRPDFVEAHNNLGILLAQQGKLDLAAARLEQVLVLKPDLHWAHYNLGNVFLNQGKLDEAAIRFEQALALRPDLAEAHNNLGTALKRQGKLREAVARYTQALALRPDYAEAQLGLATCYLVEGDYERGWPAYETRLRLPEFVPQRLNIPRWTGQPLAERSLLLVAEPGFGNTLHFVRYARVLKERGARIVLAVQAELGRLLASHPDLDELLILGSAAELPRLDFFLPLLSAPGALGTNASTIPCNVPYLWAEPTLTDKWRQELAGIDGFKIGIVWQGSRGYHLDRWRSIALAHFAPLSSLPGVQLISLQKGFGSEQVATVDFPVLDLSGRLDEVAGPFMDTAAVIRNLDLVVTADTAIAHLAGALGAPVWVALQFSSEWRWMRDRDDSPWYPTMRLFRQTTFGEWPDVFERIADAVQTRRSK
jgi:tetratricopeptide (TPR) repeat protein